MYKNKLTFYQPHKTKLICIVTEAAGWPTTNTHTHTHARSNLLANNYRNNYNEQFIHLVWMYIK